MEKSVLVDILIYSVLRSHFSTVPDVVSEKTSSPMMKSFVLISISKIGKSASLMTLPEDLDGSKTPGDSEPVKYSFTLNVTVAE